MVFAKLLGIKCPSTAFLPVWPYCMTGRRNRSQQDEVNSFFPFRELEETIGTPLYYVDEDYLAGHEIPE